MKKQSTPLAQNIQQAGLLFACAQTCLQNPIVVDNAFSDPHNGGQCAALFESGGRKYIYKPRSARVDFAWADFLDEMASVLKTPLPRAVRPVSERNAEYTIVPFLDGAQAKSEVEVRAFYERWGSLFALCVLLGATDMHSENVIADGDSPVLVDVETLLAGVTPDKAGRTNLLYDTLAFSHFLPNWMLTGGENVDVGALTGEGKNLLRMNGSVCPVHEHVDEILKGFRATYSAILSNKEKVLHALDRFSDAPFRKLLRPTDLYGRLIQQIERLDSEEEKRASAMRLKRAYARGGAIWEKKMERVLESEIESVLIGDIPYFFSYGNECCLRDAGGVVCEDYFSISPVEAAKQRLSAMSQSDLRDQENVISLSLGCVRPQICNQVYACGSDVFDALWKNAVSGSPTLWMGLMTGARGEAYFQSIGFDLYDGLTGVMVFLGAAYEATKDEKIRRMLYECLFRYRKHHLNRISMIFAEGHNVSLTTGLGGHILALFYLARVLKDEEILSDAARLFEKFDFDGFDTANMADVYGGAAGLLMALPCLKGRASKDKLIHACEKLSKCVCAFQPMLTGFGHGAAGLALALGAAQHVSGRDFSTEIRALLTWENAYFDEAEGNWADLRDPEKRGFMKGLCAGAPGIGIARAQLIRYTENEAILKICRTDIERVKAFLKAQTPMKRDTLCCSNAAMMEAERILTGEIKNTSLNREPVFYHPLGTDDFPVGLMQGLAGAGYALSRCSLRANNSFLVWETEN